MALGAIPLALVARVPAAAQSAPPPPSAASPAPAPSGSPRALRLSLRTSARTTGIDRSTAGGGQIAPEAPGFEAGSPLSPNTPYDLFSSAPEVPGITGIGSLETTATYRTRAFDFSATPAFEYLNGSVTNASYWGENLLPLLNPHLGSQALPYTVAFPTHAGQDDRAAFRLGIISGAIGTADGALALRGGYFDLAQTERFVFVQPMLTSVNPAIAYAPAESIASELAGSDAWQPDASALPLHGLDLVARRGEGTLELTDAALPSLPGEADRLADASLVFDRGEGTQFAAQVVHVSTSGLPFLTTVPFGLDPAYLTTPQGILPTSTLDGQRETIAGLHAAVHLVRSLGIDGVLDLGRSWYDAQPVARPGTQAPGDYERVGLSRTHGRTTAFVDFFRMSPRYATIVMPYGVPENQWSTAFAWPGQWLKSNYQAIDNSTLGVNRQGYRVRVYVDGGPLEIRAEYTDLRQIDPETTQTATQSGFVDGFYLPQLPADATFGRQRRYALWTAWHPRLGDLRLDIVDDTLFRPFVAGRIEDQVSYEAPQAVLTFSRHLSPTVEAAAGIGRYAIKGALAEPVDFSQRLFFIGAEIAQSPRAALLVSFRRSIFEGMTTAPSSLDSPNFTGSALIVEQRFDLGR